MRRFAVLKRANAEPENGRVGSSHAAITRTDGVTNADTLQQPLGDVLRAGTPHILIEQDKNDSCSGQNTLFRANCIPHGAVIVHFIFATLGNDALTVCIMRKMEASVKRMHGSMHKLKGESAIEKCTKRTRASGHTKLLV